MVVENILAACLAETLTLPFDTKKVLNQVDLYQNKPFKGLSVGYARQLAYGGIRLSLYPKIMEKAPSPNLIYKVGAGFLSGGIGITVASPADLIKGERINTSTKLLNSIPRMASLGYRPNR